ncbi:hypothetical protein AMS56_25080 [Burkholderia pseudomallei]|nr:hypothetical protein AMS56_25080 [Burkholderia pseudomallei]
MLGPLRFEYNPSVIDHHEAKDAPIRMRAVCLFPKLEQVFIRQHVISGICIPFCLMQFRRQCGHVARILFSTLLVFGE